MNAYWCISCISALLGFYLYLFIDGAFLLVVSTQCILLYYVSYRNTKNYNLVVLRIVFIMATVGAFIGYVSGLQYHIMQFMSYEYKKSISIFVDVSHHIKKLFLFLSHIRVDEVADNMYRTLTTYTHENTASIIIALTTGNKTYLHLAFSDLVRRSGVSHLLALSGFHLSILLIVVDHFWKILRIVSKNTLGKYVVLVSNNMVIWLYGIWIGFNPSLYRAITMYTLSSICKVIFGRSSFFHVWVMSGLILQMIYPPIMYSHGFILSMLALLGVKLGIYAHTALSRIIPPIVSLPCMIGMGATFCTAWYSYIFFGHTYPIGLFVSILLTPCIALCMLLGLILLLLLTLPLHGILHGITENIASIVGRVLDICVDVIRLVLSYSARSVVVDTPHALIFFYIVLLGIIVLYICITMILQRNGIYRLLWSRSHTKNIISA